MQARVLMAIRAFDLHLTVLSGLKLPGFRNG
jgi:hypothetical protein